MKPYFLVVAATAIGLAACDQTKQDVQQGVEKTGEGAQAVAEGAWDATKATGEAVGEGAQSLAEGTWGAVQDTATGVKDVTEGMWDGTKDAAKATGEAVETVGQDLQKAAE